MKKPRTVEEYLAICKWVEERQAPKRHSAETPECLDWKLLDDYAGGKLGLNEAQLAHVHTCRYCKVRFTTFAEEYGQTQEQALAKLGQNCDEVVAAAQVNQRELPLIPYLASFGDITNNHEVSREPDTEDAEMKRKLNDLVVNCPELRELEKLLGKFNVFRVLRFEHGELRHSNVLAWLFQPEQSHGLGDLFLRRWLMRVLNDSPANEANALDPAEIDACEIRSVRVRREWRNIDVVINIETYNQGQWVITIENKIKARQRRGQLPDYRRIVEDMFKNARHRIYIFLAVENFEEPEDPVFIPANYEQIHDVLKDCIEERRDEIGNEPLVLLTHYLEILEEEFMMNTRAIDLVQPIYANHRAALDFILKHRPDAVEELTHLVRTKLKERAGELEVLPEFTNKGCVRFIPQAWDVEQNRKGKAWSPSCSRYILCEIDLWPKSPTLKIVEGKAPKEWRDKLWERSKEKPFTNKRRTKQPAYWMSVYSIKGSMTLEDLEDSDLEKLSDAVLEWLKEEVGKDNFRSAVAEIKELLRELDGCQP